MDEKEVFRIISDNDILKLLDKYKNFLPRTAHVYNFLNCIIKWKQQRPNEEYATLWAPHGNSDDGTFIAIQKYSTSTLEENLKTLYNALVTTKIIDWSTLLVLHAVTKDHFPIVWSALHKVPFSIDHSNTYDVWWMPKEKALKFKIEQVIVERLLYFNGKSIDCPSGVYVKELEKAHAAVINSHWSSTFPESEKYLATFIELNGGYGVFLKSCNTMVAGILQNQVGLGALQTIESQQRKGYGCLIAKHMARKISEAGEDPLGIVLQTNVASQALFKKLGFVIVESVVFTEAKAW